MNSLESFRLSQLPGYAKLFVAITTALMLLVVGWAMFIYYVDKGIITEDEIPDYSYDAQPSDSPDAEADRQQDISAIEDDPEAELAPIWDSTMKGRPAKVDSATLAQKFRERDSEMAAEVQQLGNRDARKDLNDYYGDRMPDWQTQLRRNVGLAHTHINGQTLLFAVLGLFFLFTSVPVKTKKLVLWLFGIAIVLHAIGLSGETFSWFFDDILALSGVGMLILMAYMSFIVFVELGKRPKE